MITYFDSDVGSGDRDIVLENEWISDANPCVTMMAK